MPMQSSLEILEWPALFGRLLAECWTPYGVRDWENAPFFNDELAIEAHLAEVEALKTVLLRFGEPILDGGAMPDIETVLRRVAKGGTLTLHEVRQVLLVLRDGLKLCRYVEKNQKASEDLLSGFWKPIAADLSLDLPQDVLVYLDDRIDAYGELKDSASETLGLIRRRLIGQRKAIQQQCQTYFRNSEVAQALQSQTVTEREGRYVLPVKVELKGRVPGIVHGNSATGSTLYVEPQGLMELNNAVLIAHADLAREVSRIVQEISETLGQHTDRLKRFTDLLGALDRRMAAARLSRLLDANVPTVLRLSTELDLKKARHPLLVLQAGQNRHAVIPNDIALGRADARTLLITGPNTGGKTVLLKTIGLLALMLRAGLHLPTADGSAMAMFNPVLADIGDQQSISQNLSTFSGHISRLKSFMAENTNLTRGLVLIDEIAAGTDPAEGAALAKSMLDTIYQKGALTVVTTHLGELKIEAHQHPGYLNASVEFDPETLSPTYRLMMGVPGTSNAITIAQKLGIDQVVIDKARSYLSAPVRKSAELIEELERKNRLAEEELHRAASFRQTAEELYQTVQREQQELEAEKRRTLKTFRTSIKSRIQDLESQVKVIKKEVQQQRVADAEQTARHLKHLSQSADEALEEEKFIQPKYTLRIEDIKPGDRVYSRQLDITGEVASVSTSSQEVTIQAGLMKMTVPVSDLEREAHRHRRTSREARQKHVPKGEVITERRSLEVECDVRGQNAADALEVVEKFIDDAMLGGYAVVGIIHGLGTGVLKREIRAYLKQAPVVRRYYPAPAMDGGDGKTIVEL